MASKIVRASETVTTTKTYYDSKGNVVNSVTDVHTHDIPVDLFQTDDKTVGDFTTEESENTSKHVDQIHVNSQSIRAAHTATDSRNYFGSDAVDSRDMQVGHVYDMESKRNSTDNAKFHRIENYVDTYKVHQKQMSSSSANFYGNDDNTESTVRTTNVDNTIPAEDTSPVFTRAMAMSDSHDRNYGKDGWHGKFTQEHHQ